MQPAKLLARCKTLFRHYSVAASICGNYVAATGNSGLLSVFRVQRSNTNTNSDSSLKTPPAEPPVARPAAAAAAAAAGAAANAANAAGADNMSAALEGDAVDAADEGEGEGQQQLEWQLVHVATLLCKNGPETMVNSVRFGHFAGRLRMLVAHQVCVGGGGQPGRNATDSSSNRACMRMYGCLAQVGATREVAAGACGCAVMDVVGPHPQQALPGTSGGWGKLAVKTARAICIADPAVAVPPLPCPSFPPLQSVSLSAPPPPPPPDAPLCGPIGID